MQFGLMRPGEANDAAPREEARFGRILCRIPTDPKNRLVGLETSRRSRMVCSLVPDQLFRKEQSLEGIGDKEIRFHRILRGNRDSKFSPVQEMLRRSGLDSGRFERSRRSRREQRATSGAWSPMGKRSKIERQRCIQEKVKLLHKFVRT